MAGGETRDGSSNPSGGAGQQNEGEGLNHEVLGSPPKADPPQAENPGGGTSQVKKIKGRAPAHSSRLR
jgi:hypothetical protein